MFKPLRIILVLSVLLISIFATTPGTEVLLSGIGMIPTLLLPVIAPIIFFVLLLDALMLRVFLADKQGKEKKQYQLSLYVNLTLVVVLVLRWYPYFKEM